jgi:fluoroacetyl-CoA thioesterase
MELEPGLAARVELTVTDADTAEVLGSGNVPVLATPRILALAEAATVAVTARRLQPGSTTVGTRVELEHLAPTPVGGKVAAEAILSSVDGRRLGFTVAIRDGEQVVARGTIERVIVEREKFVAKAYGL